MNKRLVPPVYGNLYYSLRTLTVKIDDLLKSIADTKKHLVLLDFGCGSKPYKSLIEKHNIKYLGADLVSVPDTDIELSNGNLLIEDNSVDIVLSSQVLEHVYDVDKYLNECLRILKPNGSLILTTHGHWIFHPDPNDYWRWTSQGLKETISRNHFEIKKFEGVMNINSIALQYLQDNIRGKLRFKIIVTGFTYFMQCLIRMNEKITKKSADHDAGIFVVHAVKK